MKVDFDIPDEMIPQFVLAGILEMGIIYRAVKAELSPAMERIFTILEPTYAKLQPAFPYCVIALGGGLMINTVSNVLKGKAGLISILVNGAAGGILVLGGLNLLYNKEVVDTTKLA